jgi:hypothetical protein
MEACQGRWRPVIGALAADHRAGHGVPSIADSVATFNQFVRPLERAQGTRSKYMTHRLSILTWATWKGCLPHLLPMTDDLLRAYLWDSLAFEASVSVLKHAVDAVKGWHRRLGMPAPMDGPGAYRSVINSLRRFQPVPRILKFPIPAPSPQVRGPPPPDRLPASTSAVRGRQAAPPQGPLDSLPNLLDLPSPLVQLPGRSHGHAHLLPLQGAWAAPDVRHLVG